jgi:thiol peroxidase
MLGAIVAYAFVAGCQSRHPTTAPAAENVREVTSSGQYDAEVRSASGLALVDFYAVWCPPCKALAPRLEALAGQYAGRVAFYRVDAEKLTALAEEFEITAYPTVVLLRGGQVVQRWVGLREAGDYRDAIDGALSGPSGETTVITTVMMKGKPLPLAGKLPVIGQEAPEFTALANDLSEVSLSSLRGKIVVILSVPSLDTRVCDTETRHFNEEAAKLGPNVKILAISADLPFAQARWCAAAGVEAVQTLSDHRQMAFGRAYGVLIEPLRLEARAVFVIDPNGVLRYSQLVDEVSHEPDYAAALAAVSSLTGR